MKKIYLFLFITCFISINSIDARSVAEVNDVQVQTSVTTDQYDLEVIIKALEDLGFEIDELDVISEPESKECTITIKGTYKGEEVDLTITIKGQTCAEFFRELMK